MKINWNNPNEVRAYHKEYNLRPKVKQQRKEQRKNKIKEYEEYRKRYREKYPKKIKEQNKKNNEKWRKKNPNYQKDYNKNNFKYTIYQNKYHKKYDKEIGREKYLIRQLAYYSLRKKLISLRKVCEFCGSNKNLEMHHNEYINDLQFLILLCRKCHKALHKGEINKMEVIKWEHQMHGMKQL